MEQDLLTNLPPEIMIEILSRLPVLTIMSCKRVCKPWLDLISSNEFVKSHLSKSAPGLVVFQDNGRSKPYEFFEFVEEVDHEQPAAHHCNIALNFRSPYNVRIHSSVNGLLFMHDLFIYNPITSEYITLPPPDSYSAIDPFGFGVSKISNQYKLVRVFRSCWDESAAPPKCNVYTLGTGSWRSIAGCPPTIKYASNEAGAFVNGNLHWLAFDSEGDDDRICCFDLETELFSTFYAPPATHYLGRLTVLEGCLCLCDNFLDDDNLVDDGGIIIWLMKEYGDEKSWTKQFSCKLRGLLFYFPLKVFKDGDILMAGDEDSSELVCYSNKTALTFEETNVLKKCRGSQTSCCKVIYTPSFLPLKSFVMENVSLC